MRETGVTYLKTADVELRLHPVIEEPKDLRQKPTGVPLTKEQEFNRPYYELKR